MNSDQYEFISLIIPTRNEEKYIGSLMESLLKQTYPLDKFEVLIFDGLSEDSTLKIVKEYTDKLDIKIFENKKIRQIYIWNEGIRRAKGNYFMIIGAHSCLDTSFVEKSMKTFQKLKKKEPKLAGVGGSLNKVYTNNYGKLTGLLFSSPLSGVSSFWNENEPGFRETVVYALYDKIIVEEVGMFDEGFIIGEDYELNLRINKKGYKLYCNPDILSYYFTRSSLKGFLSQIFGYGVGKGMCIRTGYNRLLWWIPFIFLLFEIMVIISLNTPLSLIMLSGVLIYFILNIISSFMVYIRTRDKMAFLLIFIHFIYHNIVALGLIKGLLYGRRTFK